MAKRYRLDSINKLSDIKKDFYSKEVKAGIRDVVSESLKSVKSKEEFESFLNQYPIQVKIAENSGGVYGVSFRPDYFKNNYIKASDVDRDLSWTGIKAAMLENSNYNINIDQPVSVEDAKVVNDEQEEKTSGVDLGNVKPPGDAGGSDPNNAEEQDEQKKKKKKKRGRGRSNGMGR